MTPLYQMALGLLNARKKKVLRFAQASLPESQFQAFRQLFLDEFGRSGFEKELENVMAEKKHKER